MGSLMTCPILSSNGLMPVALVGVALSMVNTVGASSQVCLCCVVYLENLWQMLNNHVFHDLSCEMSLNPIQLIPHVLQQLGWPILALGAVLLCVGMVLTHFDNLLTFTRQFRRLRKLVRLELLWLIAAGPRNRCASLCCQSPL